MVELGDDGGEFRKVVQPKHDDPGFVILAVADDGNFRFTAVRNGLFQCFIQTEFFSTFAFDMDAGNIRDDIRRIGRTLELLSAPGGDTEDARQFVSEFPFAGLPFIARETAHDV